MTWVHTTNEAVAKSVVGRWFRLDGSGHVSYLPPMSKLY
jgi:hypothetical protein